MSQVAQSKKSAAFDGLLSSIAAAPLAHMQPAGYLYTWGDGMAFTMRRPVAPGSIAVYTFGALQEAFATGRGMTVVDEKAQKKAEQRGYHEYRSWAKNISADRKRRNRSADHADLRGAANILRAMNFHGLATAVERARAELTGAATPQEEQGR